MLKSPYSSLPSDVVCQEQYQTISKPKEEYKNWIKVTRILKDNGWTLVEDAKKAEYNSLMILKDTHGNLMEIATIEYSANIQKVIHQMKNLSHKLNFEVPIYVIENYDLSSYTSDNGVLFWNPPR